MGNKSVFNDVVEHFPDGRMSEINLSNIGRYPFACNYNEGQVRLQGLHVINNFSVYHTSAVIFITCAGDGQLDFSMSHEMETDERAQEFLEYFVRLIETCADAVMDLTLYQLLSNMESK